MNSAGIILKIRLSSLVVDGRSWPENQIINHNVSYLFILSILFDVITLF